MTLALLLAAWLFKGCVECCDWSALQHIKLTAVSMAGGNAPQCAMDRRALRNAILWSAPSATNPGN
ncbi:hypothetical protein E2C01_038130 [Portunus trituberculatus]|uniref:Uncharacterized protein n=1 Tax=Portunus trituberculatus TaxID=210409 RepID=A0A5B7FHP6_PORTR|nr:hypothetical protein [Portunus trituberculatus]